MEKRLRYLISDIAFVAVLALCTALGCLALWYQTENEKQQLAQTFLSVATRDITHITNNTGYILDKLVTDLDRTLASTETDKNNTNLLKHVLQGINYLQSISLVDANGKVIDSTTPANIGLVLPDTTFSPLRDTKTGLQIGVAHAGTDLVNARPVNDNAHATPDPGCLPISIGRKDKPYSILATIKLGFLVTQSAHAVDTPGTRISFIRTDGRRLLDTIPPDAITLDIERDTIARWRRNEQIFAREVRAINNRAWIVADSVHPQWPFGVVWAAERDTLLADTTKNIQHRNLTIMLLLLAGMACVLFGYVFFRLARRHERERHLQIEAQRRLLDSTLNACASAIVITSPNGTIEWVNPAYTTLTGYTAAESIGRNARELTKSGAQSDGFYAQMWRTILDGHVWHGDLVNRRKDGSLYDERLTINPALNSNGEIRHFIATKEDYTEHKATREGLEVLHSHLNAVVENFPGALVMEDTIGRIVLLNQFLFELLSLPGSNDYVLGRPIYPLMSLSSHITEDSRAFMTRIEELRASERAEYGEEIHLKDGRWVERDFIPIRLHEKLIGFLYIYRDISQRKRHARELWQLATSDPLTGIPNRRAFFEQMEHERMRLVRYPGDAAVLMLDIDHFKQINDTHGHAAGDAMLCHIVRQARKLLRESDVLARLGGEEFAILLPQSNLEGAVGLAERLRKTLIDNPLLYNDNTIHVTTSVGVTTLSPKDASTDQTMSRVDHALYEAKHKGRNRVETA